MPLQAGHPVSHGTIGIMQPTPQAVSAAGIGAIAVAVFAATAVRALVPLGAVEFDPSVRAESPRANTASRPMTTEDQPRELIIPNLGIGAAIEPVGVTPKGAMAAPASFRDVGWYRYGPAPGQEGSAVIAGHVDNALGLSGVFKRLDELEREDDIVIRADGGKTLVFRVTEIRTVPLDEVPAERVFDTAGEPRLVLITCAGRWLRDRSTYDQRLLVFATLR
ncbi:class F sortase [Candidatus Parcubacteria bacterium]|nr:MAG: class F sortase [Candidatus Parcubacteria bacterium]